MAILALGALGTGAGTGMSMASLGLSLITSLGSLLFPQNQSTATTAQDGKLRFNDNLASTSAYGAVIPVGYGVYKTSGNVIWSSPILEKTELIEVGQVESGKGGGPPSGPAMSERAYLEASMAIAFGEVPQHRLEDPPLIATSEDGDSGDVIEVQERKSFAAIRRVWLNNEIVYDVRTDKEGTVDNIDLTIYLGDESQSKDEMIVEYEGEANTPNYKGIVYVVLPNMDLTPYGNGYPQATAEIYERLDRIDALEEGVEGLCRDPDGDIWVTSHTMRVVQRVDPNTFEIKARVGRDNATYDIYENNDPYLGELPAHPWRCAASPDGLYVWVVHRADWKITRISRADNSWETFTTEKYAYDVAVDGDNNVWVTYPFYDKVVKYNSSGVKVKEIIISDAPWYITAVAGRNIPSATFIWVGGNKQIHKIEPNPNNTDDYLALSLFTGRTFYSACAGNSISADLWCVATGDDLATIVTRSEEFNPAYPATSNQQFIHNDSVRRERNTGTIPIGCDIHPTDSFGTVYISTFGGNRVTAYSYKTTKQMEVGTIGFPGLTLAQSDGKVFVTNTKLGIIQRIETR